MKTACSVIALTALAAALTADDWQIPKNTLQCFLDAAPLQNCEILRSGVQYHHKFDAVAQCVKCTAPLTFAYNTIEAEVETTVGVTRACDYSVWSEFSGGIASINAWEQGIYMWVYAYLQQYTFNFPWSVTAYDAVDCDDVGGLILPEGSQLPCGIEWS